MYKLKNNKLTNLLGSVCSIMLLVLAFLIITPPVYDGVNAEQTGTQLPVEVKAGLILSLALDQNSVYLGEVSPTTNGTFVEGSVKLTAETNAVDGYKLYINTADSSTATTKVSEGVSTIPSISSAVDKANFPANQWGYSIATGNTASSTYEPIKARDNVTSPVTTTSAGSESYTLNFATKLDTTLPAGTYRNNMIVSAVTDPVRILTLNDISTMQEMTSEICSNTLAANAASLPAGEKQLVTPGNEPSKQLIDTRDGKQYWVSKLADQNCWMTQNLALNLDPAKPLTPDDSDVSSTWIPTKTAADASSTDSSQLTNSWNLGEYVLKNPTEDSNCGPQESKTPLAACSEQAQLINDTWSPTLDASQYGNIAVDVNNKIYDAHYLVGNYYQFGAAIADANTTASENYNTSICPKNWQLPIASTVNDYSQLIKSYDISSIDKLTMSPLYFTRAGYSSNEGVFIDLGTSGHYLTGSTRDYHVLTLGFLTNISTDYGIYQYRFASVRCLAR